MQLGAFDKRACAQSKHHLRGKLPGGGREISSHRAAPPQFDEEDKKENKRLEAASACGCGSVHLVSHCSDAKNSYTASEAARRLVNQL